MDRLFGSNKFLIPHRSPVFSFCRLTVFLVLFILSTTFKGYAQIDTKAEVFFNPVTRTLSITQTLSYRNKSKDTLRQFYFNDWANAFKSKVSPLGKHFSSTYLKQFYFSSLSERGETRMDFIKNKKAEKLTWTRPAGHPDLVQVHLKTPLLPGETKCFQLQYTIRIAQDKFTGYGKNENGNFNLRYWLISPAAYREGWQVYSHKDLGDKFQPKTDAEITLKLPLNYQVYSSFLQDRLPDKGALKQLELSGKNRADFKLALVQKDSFETFKTSYGELVTNIEGGEVPVDIKEVSAENVMQFLNERLGGYPHKKIFVTETDYQKSPIYGLNQLPDFIRPFPDGFLYNLKMMKAITHHYLRSTLFMNLRKEEWILNAIEIDLMMDYVDTFYPNTKLIGKLSTLIGVRWTHLADLDFNAQYQFLFMNVNRLNLDQALGKSKDSLVKFNQQIANPYKAGVGFKYLEDYLGDRTVQKTIREFYQKNKLTRVSPTVFKQLLKENTSQNIDWFFEEYAQTNVRLDFTIKTVKNKGDSLEVTIQNKEDNHMPVSLYGLDKDWNIVSKDWVKNTEGETTVTIPRKNITRLGVNYEGIIPEINQRNNYKNLRSIFDKPLQFRLFKDIEDPHYTQFFIMPEFTYNLYDGFTLGSRISNKAILKKPFTYSITPQYGFKSRAFVGRLTTSYTQQFRNQNLSQITYGFVGNRYQYDYGLFYNRISPYVSFNWRHRDLRNRERQSLFVRNVNVFRDQPKGEELSEKPNYNVFDIKYNYSNKTMVNSFASTLDFQYAHKFSKISYTAKYRKLFLDNRQLEFRLFLGAFVFNHTDENSDFFSFGLDRPTDYLFDSNYYGRSESSGVFSQQYIEADGGFKSQLEPSFANQWMATFNTSASVWQDVLYLYSDVGMLKNSGQGMKVRFDSGVRLSLVQDYFELFFPVYSNLGWEIGQSDYDKKIRFIVTLDFQTLMGLFGRTYY